VSFDPTDYTMSNYDDIKAECYEANLLLPEYKLIDLTFGNVSVAVPERRVFAIKPSGVDYSSMKVDDMVVLDFDGKLVEGSLRPSSDTPTHQRLLKAFTGIRSGSCTLTRAMQSHSRKPAEEFHVSAPRTPIISTVKCR
jgi:L-ribulose-5-phosphate 4-epimerase